MKQKIDKAILLHSKEKIKPTDILKGDRIIFDALFNRQSPKESEYIELRDYIENKLVLLLASEINPINVEFEVTNEIDAEILEFLNNELANEYKDDVCRLALGEKKMLRAKLFLSQLKQSNYRFAALIELFHLVTLIQDDVIDKASHRRYQETLNYRYSDRTAILVADLLLCKITNSIYEAVESKVKSQKHNGRKEQAILKYFNQIFSKLITGLIDSELNAKSIKTLSDYESYAQNKTANFFGFAMALGYLMNEELEYDFKQLEKKHEIGSQFGLLFQKIDDLLDYDNQYEVSGKSSRDDENGIKNYLYFKLQKKDISELRKELLNELDIYLNRAEFNDVSNGLLVMKRRINGKK